MRQWICLLGLFLFWTGNGYAETAPIHLGGFTLGNDISRYTDCLEESSFRKIRYSEYMGEVEIKSVKGFVSGSIAFGLCDQPNKIVRIKLKYDDPSRVFFDHLLERFETALGDPDEYKGDPFQTMIVWKWSFDDDTHGKISLILQHNTKNPDEKYGNAVKLTKTGQIEMERLCMQQKSQDNGMDKTSHSPVTHETMWKRYVPY